MLLIAIVGLSYTIYRANLNQNLQTKRDAAFTILLTANELQTTIDRAHFGKGDANIHFQAWSKILFIDDLAVFLSESTQKNAKTLHFIWQHKDNETDIMKLNKKLSKQIKLLRENVKQEILQLE